VPLSTKIIQSTGEATEKNVVASQKDPSILATPENVNKITDRAEESVINKRQEKQTEQEALRSLAVGINQIQHQQSLIDQYIDQNSDSSENASSANIYDLIQQNDKSQKLETLSNISKAKNNYTDVITPKEPSFFHIQV
jgi:hypothetical protein